MLIRPFEDKSSWGGGGRGREREGGSGRRFAVSIFAECENVQDDLISGPADWHKEHGTISSPTAQNC